MGKAKRVDRGVELDLGRYELRRSERRIALERKPMELLIFLVGRRDQMVSREEIIQKLWRSDLFIDTERNLNNIVRKLRTALADDANAPVYNPAGISFITQNEVTFMYARLFSNVNFYSGNDGLV